MSHIALLSRANTLISILKLFRSSSKMSLLALINFLMSVVNKEIVLVLTATVHFPKQTLQTASHDHCNTLAAFAGSITHLKRRADRSGCRLLEPRLRQNVGIPTTSLKNKQKRQTRIHTQTTKHANKTTKFNIYSEQTEHKTN